MRRFLQLRPEFIFSSLIFEFGNASKATSGVRCNIIIGQPQFAKTNVSLTVSFIFKHATGTIQYSATSMNNVNKMSGQLFNGGV